MSASACFVLAEVLFSNKVQAAGKLVFSRLSQFSCIVCNARIDFCVSHLARVHLESVLAVALPVDSAAVPGAAVCHAPLACCVFAEVLLFDPHQAEGELVFDCLFCCIVCNR
jgi:hypothetical protein